MGLLSGIARACLVIINIIFLLIGLAVAAVGFILRFGKALWEDALKTGINLLKKVGDDTQLLQNLDTDNLDIGSIVQTLAIGLIVGGLVLCVISVVGCCGACYKIKIMLWIYLIVIAVFIIGEAVAVGLLYGKPEIVKDQLKKTSVTEFKGLASAEVLSLGWNIVMMEFECCGVDSYEDFNVSTSWDRKLGKKQLTKPLLTPIACCKTLPTSSSVHVFSCAQAPLNEDINNGKIGCYNKIWGLSFGKTAIAVPVLVICGIIEIAFIIFAVVIIKSEKNSVSPI